MPGRDGSRVYSKIAQRLQPGPFSPQGLTTSFASTEFDKTVSDLYLADPNVLRYLVDLYFSHVNNEILCIFPCDTFMGWLTTLADTTLDTLLPLHAMIAVGSVFADGEHAAVGKFFADKAT
jgi:TRAP-type mannitol/chloroaromatic compound transport system permease large subunit